MDTRDNSIFQGNVASDDSSDTRPLFVDWDSGNTNTDNEFWSVYLLGAYQHTLLNDRDPNIESPIVLGIVDEITKNNGDEGSGALIFTEIHRPNELPGYTSSPTNMDSMAVTVAHEVAHLFSCEYGDGGLMGNTLSGVLATNQLSPKMIFKIKKLKHP